MGALHLYVSLDMNHCRERDARADSVRVCIGGSCCRGQGMTSALCELLGRKGTGVAALHEYACELLQVTAQEWGLCVGGRELL